MKRADRIEQIILNAKSQSVSVKEIHNELERLEETESLHHATVSATVRQDNRQRESSGRAIRFNLVARGFIGLYTSGSQHASRKDILKDSGNQIPQLIEQANTKIREKLISEIKKLSWQEFESNFLDSILDALGFSDISITQKSKDGGKDAICSYKRGIVDSQAIVSAKHWTKNQNVSVSEVQRMRGIKHNADTAIIVTSSGFTKDAIEEAEPAQNTRSVVLIDGNLIVETCMKNEIGVSPINLPLLFNFDGFEENEV